MKVTNSSTTYSEIVHTPFTQTQLQTDPFTQLVISLSLYYITTWFVLELSLLHYYYSKCIVFWREEEGNEQAWVCVTLYPRLIMITTRVPKNTHPVYTEHALSEYCTAVVGVLHCMHCLAWVVSLFVSISLPLPRQLLCMFNVAEHSIYCCLACFLDVGIQHMT